MPRPSSCRRLRSASRRRCLCHRARLHGAAHAGAGRGLAAHHLGTARPHRARSGPDGRAARWQAAPGRHATASSSELPRAAGQRHRRLGGARRRSSPGRGRGLVRAGAPRRHAGHRAELLRRAVQSPRSLLALRGAARCRRGSRAPIGRAGAGLQLVRRGSAIVVAEAIADGPGALAGIRPGDTILAVDGQSTRGKDAATVTDLDRRPGGDQRRRCLARPRRPHRTRPTLERAMVPPETVFAQRIGDMLRDPDHRVQPQHRRAIWRSAIEDGLRRRRTRREGIVLDLRGNRGGLLRQAVDGGRHAAARRRRRDHRRTRSGRDADLALQRRRSGARYVPVVVLVDGRTASAAEILAAALADRGRAVVVGSSTLGKGLVQTIAPLPDGGELFVTWSRVLAPRGWPIQGLGVLPQVCTSLGQRRAELAARGAGAGRSSRWRRRWTPHRAARAPLHAGADPGDPQRLPRRRGPRGRPRHGARADPRPGRLCRRAAAAAQAPG